MSTAMTLRSTPHEEPAPPTIPAERLATASGVYRIATRRGYDARNVLASLRINVEFVRSMLRDASSPQVVEALADIEDAAERLNDMVAELG